MYKAYPIPDSVLKTLYMDFDMEDGIPCSRCSAGYLRADEQGKYSCIDCGQNYSAKDLHRTRVDTAKDQLRTGQELFAFYIDQILKTRRLCQKAERALWAELKKREDIELEKVLADLYTLQAHTYAREDLYYDDLEVEYDKVRDFLKKEADVRKDILKKEPTALNRFLLGKTLFDLGSILSEIKRRKAGGKTGHEEKEKGIELVEQAIQEAKETGVSDQLAVFEQRALDQYFDNSMENRFDWHLKDRYQKIRLDFEKFTALARIRAESLQKRELDEEDHFEQKKLLDRLLEVINSSAGIYCELDQIEEGIAFLQEGLVQARELFNQEVKELDFWKKEELFNWERPYWEQARQFRALYRNLFALYRSVGKEKKAREMLDQMSQFMHSEQIAEISSQTDKENVYIMQALFMAELAACYQKLKEYQKAQEYYLKSNEKLLLPQQESQKFQASQVLAYNFYELAELYELMDLPEKAKEAKEKARQIDQEIEEYTDFLRQKDFMETRRE